jgi:hypothetical protein
MHNGKYHTEEYKRKQAEKNDRLYGPIAQHHKTCERCNREYIFEGRIKSKAFKKAKYCSRSCANSRQEWWNENATRYRTIAFQNWKQECAICGFDKIVAVHHIDENHDNNDPHNLIPLCPNHHEMAHSKWKKEMLPLIEEAVIKRLGT